MEDTKKHKAASHAIEVLDTMGQESEKEGVKWTKYFMDKWDKKEWEKAQFEQEKLGRWTKKKKAYFELLHHLFKEKVLAIERPNHGYWAETGISTKGVWLKLHDRFGRVWAKGMKISGIPKFDHYGVEQIAVHTEDLMWKLEDQSPLDTGKTIAV